MYNRNKKSKGAPRVHGGKWLNEDGTSNFGGHQTRSQRRRGSKTNAKRRINAKKAK